MKQIKKNGFIKQKRKKGQFTYYLNKSRNRHKFKGVPNDLDEEYLKSIWTGYCAISKLPIKLYNCKEKSNLFTASLDRIDSNIGYLKGNVQFVAYGINLAKNNFSNEEIKEFINSIKIIS